MKFLIFGPSGQVGWELQRALAPLGELICATRAGHNGLCGDLTQLPELAHTIRAVRPDVIVNAAAYTAVDKAESDVQAARRINAEAPAVMAAEAASLGSMLVHYSTDYVFDGSGDSPRDESAATGPLSVYGQTKLEGELSIQASGCRHLILRTSWVHASLGGNFAKTILRLARERSELRIINDQIGAPTGADLIADVTAHALRQPALKGVSGTYHMTAGGETSWHGYARFVVERALGNGMSLKARPDDIHKIATSEYPTPARRPLNSRLDTRRFQATFGLALPHWTQGVARLVDEISRTTA